MFQIFTRAEAEGFEPTEVLPSSVFKTDVIDHSTKLPLFLDPIT